MVHLAINIIKYGGVLLFETEVFRGFVDSDIEKLQPWSAKLETEFVDKTVVQLALSFEADALMCYKIHRV